MTILAFNISSGPNSGRQIRVNRPSPTPATGRYRSSPSDYIGSFYSLLHQWRSETAFESDPDRITANKSYASLVKMADLVVPLIVDELKNRPSALVWVLDDAFGETPYGPDAVGDMTAMAAAWIAWAERNGRSV